MNIPCIDNNNNKDIVNAINTKFVSVSSHIEPLNISTLPALYQLMTRPYALSLECLKKNLRLSNHLKPVAQTVFHLNA